jgi:long-subunit acyl-CoA synthetase (AMP-forming)
MAEKVTDLLDDVVRRHGDRPALKHKRDGAWQTITWREYREQVRLAARGFIKLGLGPGQGVAIIGHNCPEWFFADVGAIAAGGVPAGIYTTSSPEQCQYIASHCDAPVVVVENREQLAKFKKVRDQLPKLRALVVMHGSVQGEGEGIYSWADLLKIGQEVPESELETRIAAQKPDDMATLIYTSGTTGPPKAVMITHRNVIWVATTVVQYVKLGAEDRFISYLPLSHIAEQATTLYGSMMGGCCVHFAESMDKLGDNLREVRPTMFLGVPRVWEKIQAKMQAAGAQAPPLRKKIAAWARKQGLAGGFAEQRGEAKPMLYGLANKVVFSKVRERIGLDQCRFQATAAAPISRDTLEFFLSLGIPIYEIYGMSECTGPATLSLPGRYRTGKAGFILPGSELKIAEDGEICMRGPHVFKGYYKDPESTAATIDAEGWLHSGDIGMIDADGFLSITDRKKDLLITAGGENVAPQLIEAELKAIPGIAQAVVVGDRMKYLAALLTLDAEKLPSVAQTAGSPARTVEEARHCGKIKSYLEGQVAAVNQRLARVQTIKRWVIVPGEFTIEGGELTPTMKIKRKVIREKYAKEIESLYIETGSPASGVSASA